MSIVIYFVTEFSHHHTFYSNGVISFHFSIDNNHFSGWLFPIMWLIVSKPTQYAAVWRLVNYCQKNACDATMGLSIPLLAYSIHLSLGDAWNKVFFGTESTGRGLGVISAFWTVLWSTAYLFYRVDTISGLLLLPTCLWVTVAASLNWSIYRLNK